MNKKKVGEVLRYLRKRAKITQMDSANTLGVNQSSISKIESGVNDLRLQQLMALLKLYDATLEEFSKGLTKSPSAIK